MKKKKTDVNWCSKALSGEIKGTSQVGGITKKVKDYGAAYSLKRHPFQTFWQDVCYIQLRIHVMDAII